MYIRIIKDIINLNKYLVVAEVKKSIIKLMFNEYPKINNKDLRRIN